MGTLEEGQTRLDQYDVLHWVWLLVRKTNHNSLDEEPLLNQITKEIDDKLLKLSHAENIDFEELIKKLMEDP